MNLSSAYRKLNITSFSFGMFVVFWVLCVTLFLQVVVLGLLLPDWSDGHGLIPGQDVTAFHRVASEQVQLIHTKGWSAWELRPNGWGVSGIMSAWYALTLPEPWVLAPIQALMYGISIALLAKLVFAVTGSNRLSLLAILPAVFLPSAAIVYAQPHRDLYVMFGLMLAIYGWWLLFRMQQVPFTQALRLAVCATMLITTGFVVAWVVREFSAEIFQGLAALFVLLLGLLAWYSMRHRPCYRVSALASPIVALLLLFPMASFHSGDFFSNELKSDDSDTSAQQVELDRWLPTAWLPGRVDDSLRRLSGARDHFIRGYSHGRTAIDTDIHFRHVADVVAYTPRAAHIGVFSPFPSQWLPHPDAEPVRNAYRMLGGAEMALLYVIMPFLLYAGWCWWRRPAFWVLLMPALAWVMVYAYTVPVVGSLVRYRFPGYIILVALAVGGLGQAVLRWQAMRRARFAD